MSTKQSTHVLHGQPAWRSKANFIIDAPLPASDEPKKFEQLWTRQISDQEFEICCIPFFLFDVALGDVVSTASDGSLVLQAVVRPSGRWVFRAIFPKSPRPNEDILEGLAYRGALIEWSSATMISIDAAHAVMAQEVADYLAELEDAHRLVYETGKS